MARRKESREGTEVGFDMTPMIDVVFLMIIFFMIVTDLTQQDLAELTLPVANEAVQDEMMEGRLIVNVLRDGRIEIKRTEYPSLEDPLAVNVLRNYLAVEVQKGTFEEGGFSEKPLLIRADKKTEFKHLQKIMRICGETGIQIYKIELAAAQNEQ
jgi:biopolymer transport protein ExbD